MKSNRVVGEGERAPGGQPGALGGIPRGPEIDEEVGK